MDSRIPRSIRVLTERLSRREALQAYVPPALSMVVLAGAKNSRNFGSLGVERVEVRGGGGNGGGHPGGGGNDTPNFPDNSGGGGGGNGGGHPGNGGGHPGGGGND